MTSLFQGSIIRAPIYASVPRGTSLIIFNTFIFVLLFNIEGILSVIFAFVNNVSRGTNRL